MQYEEAKNLNNKQFVRLIGIKKETFKQMAVILKREEELKKSKAGRKSKLSVENRLMMTLEYYREYRTYFHIGKNYGIGESGTYKIITRTEDILIKYPEFALPGNKAFMQDPLKNETALVDVTEIQIQRPKKNKKSPTPEKINFM
jgi:hypothetical protein